MYQLNHMLTEQKNMMTYIMENSISSDKVEVSREDEEDSRKNLAFLMEKVEGCSVSYFMTIIELEVEGCKQGVLGLRDWAIISSCLLLRSYLLAVFVKQYINNLLNIIKVSPMNS